MKTSQNPGQAVSDLIFETGTSRMQLNGATFVEKMLVRSLWAAGRTEMSAFTENETFGDER